MSGEAAKLIDTEVLQSLREAIGDGIKRIIQLYLDQFPQDMQQMQQALKNNDFETLGRLAHSLKSSSANLGAMRISAIAAQLETYIKSGETNAEHISDSINNLNICFDQVQHLYSEYLS